MENKTYPSLSYFTDSLVRFDKDVLMLLEKEILKDNPSLYGKRQFVKKLLDQVLIYKRKNYSNPDLVDKAIVKLGACVSIMGDKPPLREDVLGIVRELALKHRPNSKDVVDQSHAVQKLLEEKEDLGVALILSYVIDKDDVLKKSYLRLVSFYRKLQGSERKDLSFLFDMIPAKIDSESINYLKGKVGEVSILPSKERLFDREVGEIVEDVKLGKVSFRPKSTSGWISHRNYALQSLLSSGGSSDLGKEDKLTMKVIFTQALNGGVETQQFDEIVAPKFYLRLAESYSFLLDLLESSFPNSRGLKREGKHKHLTSELKQLVRMCYGLSLDEAEVAKDQVILLDHSTEILSSMKRTYDIKNTTFKQLCSDDKDRCIQLASEWDAHLP
jgi:hypothetical protein